MAKNKFILLDRDGTINVEKLDYVKSYDEFKFLPNSIKALQLLCEKNYKIIIITNQSPIGRGIFSSNDLDKIHEKMCVELRTYDVEIFDIFYCPSLPNDNDFNRKPNPGMIINASKKYGINLSETYFIGDKETDLNCADKYGIKGYLFESNNLENFIKKII